MDDLEKLKKTLEEIMMGKIKSNQIEKILAITLIKVIEVIEEYNDTQEQDSAWKYQTKNIKK